MKPIEPGCLALLRPVELVTDEFIGCEVVRVVRQFRGRVIFNCGHPHPWLVEIPTVRQIIVCACDLTRIDGGDPDAITETEKELTV